MIEFTYRVVELDKPNKNNCVYAKSCIDAMFSDKFFLEKMKTNSLLLYRKEDIDDFDSLEAPPIDRAIGYVNLENDYPRLNIKTVLFDNYISSIEYIKDTSLFPVWVITAFDVEEFELASDIHIINEAKIEYFVLSDSPAWTIARAVTVCETNSDVFQKIRKAAAETAAEMFKASKHFTPPKTELELLKVLDKNFKETVKNTGNNVIMTNKDVLVLFATKKPQLLLELLNDCYCLGFNDGANDSIDSHNIPTFDENWLNQEWDKNLFRAEDVLKYLKTQK